MKVYVCYFNYGSYEGCSMPQEVFLTEKEALDWCKNDKVCSDYREMIIE